MINLSKWMPWLWPNSWWRIRIIFPFQEKFYESSCYHDIWYWEWETEEDKFHFDNDFLEWCLKKCTGKSDAFFAKFYYKMVRLFWDYFFNYKD